MPMIANLAPPTSIFELARAVELFLLDQFGVQCSSGAESDEHYHLDYDESDDTPYVRIDFRDWHVAQEELGRRGRLVELTDGEHELVGLIRELGVDEVRARLGILPPE